MIERVRSQKRLGCSRAAWEELLRVMNAKPQEVVVRKDYLDEVVACHKQTGAAVQLQSAQPRGWKYYMVDRVELMGFVNQHGKVCPHG